MRVDGIGQQKRRQPRPPNLLSSINNGLKCICINGLKFSLKDSTGKGVLLFLAWDPLRSSWNALRHSLCVAMLGLCTRLENTRADACKLGSQFSAGFGCLFLQVMTVVSPRYPEYESFLYGWSLLFDHYRNTDNGIRAKWNEVASQTSLGSAFTAPVVDVINCIDDQSCCQTLFSHIFSIRWISLTC